LIPAAGKGSRLSLPFPKELFPIVVENRYNPIAKYALDCLSAVDINQIVFIINESKHALMGYFGNGNKFGFHISYVIQEPDQTDHKSKSPGLANALDSAYHLSKDKIVFFCMPDTIISPANVFVQAKQNAPIESDVILCLFPTSNPQKYGMVEYNSSLQVIKVIDKPYKTDLSYMWGCIIWTPPFTTFLHTAVSKKGQCDFAVILNEAIMSGFNISVEIFNNGKYYDIGTYSEITDVYRYLQCWSNFDD